MLRALDPVYLTGREACLIPQKFHFFSKQGGVPSVDVCLSVCHENVVDKVSTPWECSIGLKFFLFDRSRIVVVSPKRWRPLAKWFGIGAHWRDGHLAAPCISYGREMSLCCVQYFWFLYIFFWANFFCNC